MRNVRVLMVILLIVSFIPLAEAARKLQTATITGETHVTNKKSKLISAEIAADITSGGNNVLMTLSEYLSEGADTARQYVSTNHQTAQIGPYNYLDAPIYNHIEADITCDGGVYGSITYIEMD